MRRRLRCTAVGAATAAVALTLGACSATQQEASVRLDPPELGACRDLEPADLTEPANETAPVACAQDHTAQTFAVGDLPTSTGTAYDDPRHGRYVYDTCEPGFAEFLGADESTALRSQLSWAWFRPSELAWERGARWYRCDVVGGPEGATDLRTLPADATALFGTDYPDAWMTCARGESVQGTKVPCSEPHDWRAVTSVKLGGPDDPYPGDRLVEVRSRDYCRDSIRGWLGYPPDFDYGYTWFREDRWRGGNRRAICWTRTTR